MLGGVNRVCALGVFAAYLVGCEHGGHHAFSAGEHGGSYESHGGGGSYESHESHGGSSFEHHEPSSSYESHESPPSHEHHSEGPASTIDHVITAVGDVATAIVSSGSTGSADPPQIVLAPPPSDPPEPVALDEERALTALRRTDLSACVYQGAPRGFGRARVTFRADGKVTQVAIESPQNLSGNAAGCIGDRLAEVVAPPFTGTPVDLYATFYVR